MPLTASDPYVEFAEYIEKNHGKTDTDQVMVENLLLSISRLLDRELGQDRTRPRQFYPTTDERSFSGDGRRRLVLDDFEAIATDGIEVDTDRDDTFSTTFDLSSPWVKPYPLNALANGMPYRGLILVSVSGTGDDNQISSWPRGFGNIKITGDPWGLTAGPPEPVKDAVVLMTRHMRDLQQSGMALTLESLDQNIRQSPGAFATLRMLKEQFSRRTRGIA